VPLAFRADAQEAQAAQQAFLQNADPPPLDASAAAWQRITEHPDFTSAPARFQVTALNEAAIVLFRRYRTSGAHADLDEAIRLWQDIVPRIPPGSPDLPAVLGNCGIALQTRYAFSGDPEDLDQAIRSLDQAVRKTSSDAAELPARLSSLGAALSDRYRRSGQREDLEESIRRFELAIERTPAARRTCPHA
jgi:tetratricopeptide (TPR) repeat protein